MLTRALERLSLPILLFAVACGGSASSSPPPPAAADDAGTTKGPAPLDASVAPADSGETVERWCTTRASSAFCADFDGTNALEGWDAAERTGVGFEEVASERSAPHAVRFTERGQTTTPESTAFLKIIPASLPTKATLDVDLRIESVGVTDTDGGITPVQLAIGRKDGKNFAIKLGASLLLAQPAPRMSTLLDAVGPDGGPRFAAASVPFTALPSKQWLHLTIVLERQNEGWTATATVDGSLAASWTSSAEDLGPIDAVLVEVGSVYPSPHAQDFVADFDDVQVVVK